MMLNIVLLLAAFIGARAACDNHCSGHGECLADDVCKCHTGWGMGLSHDSGDCSDRICPYDIAWVDSPDSTNKFHKYAECSGKGICDRAAGNCLCFGGYEGSACQRASCPNDCSGHGVCTFIQDMGFGAVWNDYTPNSFSDDSKHFQYNAWDKSKSRACVCDAQYGDVDCSKRMCPYGTDILAVMDNLLVGAKYHVQKITIIATDESSTQGNTNALQGQTFALTFKSKMNETFTTIPIVYDKTNVGEMANNIRLALLNLPNKVINDITVVVDDTAAVVQTITATGFQAGSTQNIYPVVITLTFSGSSVAGTQNPVIVEANACLDGCSPKITGLQLNTRIEYSFQPISPAITFEASYTTLVAPSLFYTSYECGRRGKCDYVTGTCNCFNGYTGENCDTLHALY